MGSDPLDGLAAGDAGAYQQVYDQYGVALYRSAVRLLRSRHDAEDAVQEVFTGLARSRHRLAEVNNLRAYLFTSLRHSVIRLQKDRTLHAMLAERVRQVRAIQDRSMDDLGDTLWDMAGQLPAEQHEVVVLKLQGGLTFREIGHVCGIPQDTAASRYRYALEKLRTLLEKA